MTNSSTHLGIVSIEPNTCLDNNYVIKCHFTLDLDTFYNTNQYWWFYYIDTSHHNNSNLELIEVIESENEQGEIKHTIIMKTFWINIFKKMWKKKYYRRKSLMNPRSILLYSLNGKFPWQNKYQNGRFYNKYNFLI